MIFLDANVFIYAYYKPKRDLDHSAKAIKEQAKKIIEKINNGEIEVLTSVVHLSEVANILKHVLSNKETNNIIATLMSLDNVHVLGVSTLDYKNAIMMIGLKLDLDPNDALAVYFMKKFNISEIISFDSDFDKVSGIRRFL